jgi:hypothetical protein
VYSTVSTRRFICDLSDACSRGYISHAMRNEVTGERQREKEVPFRDHTMWLPEQRNQGNME